jgi:hypothetical protein
MEKYLSEIFTAWCLDTRQQYNKDSISSLRLALNRDCSTEKISLRSQRIGINTVNTLGKLLIDVPQIQMIDLHENVVRDKGVQSLVETFIYIGLECNIRLLDLGSNDIGAKGIEILADWLTHETCKLETLILGSENEELYGNKIDSESASKLAISLRRNNSLTALDLNRNDDIGKRDQQAFYDFADTFDLSGKGILNNIKNVNSQITYLPRTIQILRMGNINMKSSSAVNLIKSLEGNSSLRYLDLKENKLSFQVGEALAQLFGNGRSKKQSFNQKENSLSAHLNNHNSGSSNFLNSKNQGETNLQSLIQNCWECNLTTLLLQKNNLKDKGIQLLSSALKYNDSLCVLNISENLLTNEAAVFLGDYLKNNSSLTYLDLSQNQITEKGCIILAESIEHNSVLSYLNFSNNKIANLGANALAKCLIQYNISKEANIDQGFEVGYQQEYFVKKVKCNLINLILNNCEIGDEGALSICIALSYNEKLLVLGLRNNYLTDNITGKALSEILSMKRNETLLSLDLRGNQIEHPTMLEITRSLRRNKINRTMIYPNKLKKKVIQLKYTEFLLSESKELLNQHRESRKKIEEELEMVQRESNKILSDFEEFKTEYFQHYEAEKSLLDDVQQRCRSGEEESLHQLRIHESRLSAAQETFESESLIKKQIETDMVDIEKEIEELKQKFVTDEKELEEKMKITLKEIQQYEKKSSKIKKELTNLRKKVTSLEEGVSSSVKNGVKSSTKMKTDPLPDITVSVDEMSYQRPSPIPSPSSKVTNNVMKVTNLEIK